MPDRNLSLIRQALLHVVPKQAEAVAAVELDTPIASLGIDSIGLLEASVFIEDALGATFPDDRLARVETVKDFAELIQDHSSAPLRQVS